MLRSTILTLCCLLLPLFAFSQTAAHPSFSGAWRLDAAKSDFGPAEPPESATYIIKHVGPKFRFRYTQDGHTIDSQILTDGEKRVTDSDPHSETRTRAYWSGDVLVLAATQKPRFGEPGPEMKWTSRWSLSPDGKVLTIRRHIAMSGREFDQTVVFNRQ